MELKIYGFVLLMHMFVTLVSGNLRHFLYNIEESNRKFVEATALNAQLQISAATQQAEMVALQSIVAAQQENITALLETIEALQQQIQVRKYISKFWVTS